MLGDIVANLKNKGIDLTFTEEAALLIAEESYSEKYGARNMRRYIETHVEDALANEIIRNYQNNISKASIQVADGKIAIYCL
jgi:ATP-dependent Clp protease ATP-binding subunit ClpC